MIDRLCAQLSEGRGPRIWVVGDVMLDRYLCGSVDRVSPEAPVPVLRLKEVRAQLGGAANVAKNLSALAAKVALGGVVGADAAGSTVEELSTAARLGTAGLLRWAPALTTVKQRVLAGAQQLLRIDEERPLALTAAERSAILDGLARDVPSPQLILVSDYGKGVVDAELLNELRTRQRGVPIFVDPKGRDFRKYEGVALLTPNELEAAQASGVAITDEASLRRAAETLSVQAGGAAVLVTRGAQGMTLMLPPPREKITRAATGEATEHGSLLHSPARVQRVFDVTGAGDTALAALAIAWTAGLPWPEVLHIANIAAGIAVGQVGAVAVSATELLQALGHTAANAKLLGRDQLARLRTLASERRQRLVFTNGCFDILHVGHLTLLEEARNKGDLLLVAVNSDASVRRLKGSGRPVNNESERAALLAGLAAVDYVTIFDEDTPLEAILACRPDVLVKGGDYTKDTIVGAREVESWRGEVAIVPLVAGRSTTRILSRAQDAPEKAADRVA